jgi:hypothetical protein
MLPVGLPAASLSATLGIRIERIVSTSVIVPTDLARVGFSAASRMASATRSGSVVGLGSIGSLSVKLNACCGNGVSTAVGWMKVIGDGGLVHLLDLHAQRVGEALRRVLARHVHTLDRRVGVRDLADHVDQGPSFLLQVRQGRQRGIDDAAAVDVERTPGFGVPRLVQPPPYPTPASLAQVSIRPNRSTAAFAIFST